VATEVKLPRLGQGMESGTIVRWLKREGDAVKKREPLYELDTDKVTQEVEAEADGVLVKIVVPEGEVEVGATIAMIDTDGDETKSGDAPAAVEARRVSPGTPSTPAAPAAPTGSSSEPQVAAPASAARPGARVKASPLARRIARERGVDLAALVGTGPDGRIVAEDVEKGGAASTAPAALAPLPSADVEIVQLTSVRKTIARRLTEAWAAPVFQLGVSVDMTEALALREELVARLAEGEVKPTVNDVLTRLVGVALTRHRAINATFDGETIQRHPAAQVGIAVAAPNGLVVPVVRDAGRCTIQEIARQRVDLVGRARDGKLTLDDMQGGTFTISNLGMFGIEQFVAVLNPPQVAILAVGAVKDAPIVVDGELGVAPQLQMTLTCDHRAIDGADGAEFLRTLVALVEQPALAL
jgi:pyruvate dehydrogenase E2 component (dihydrolipoamide acetyltransferase)